MTGGTGANQLAASLEAKANRARELLRLNRPSEAMRYLEQAVSADPRLRAECHDPARITDELQRCRVVLENCGKILRRYPDYAPAHYSAACALMNLGETVEATRACERALVLDPTVPVYYHILVYAGNDAQKAAAVAALEQFIGQEAALPNEGAAMLHFLLGKAYDEKGRYTEAFEHLRKANAIKRQTISYDEQREIGRLQAIARTFPATLLETVADSGHHSSLPVFVVGMPRSGTTLVEQILASHPVVYGGGELTYLPDLVRRDWPEFPENFLGEPVRLRRLGQDYVATLAALAPKAERVVDKLPLNFLHLGLIRLALPEARIIHVMRDPLDTCLSCYSLMFAGDVGFAYDLGELGRYYKAYETLMAYWRTVLPPDALLEVRYEDLVLDLPAHAQRIVAHCGLPWDARCMDFHAAARAVVTASAHQVRQPVYRTAIGRAQNYGAVLAPLREALGI